ncbi:MAG: ClpXP protease specificity-enhancing factor [Rhodocyclales bacterium]|nr:ClpXP protease specificity-enhancing factor [Rhodocyclales bacterium]
MDFSQAPADLPSTKPYLVRAIWEWCNDNGFTPYMAVEVDGSCRVPMEFVKDGQIVLNIGMEATNKLQMGNDMVSFQARFGGVARDISVPIARVAAVYARENGAGMAFEVEEVSSREDETPEDPPEPPPPSAGRPHLQRIK